MHASRLKYWIIGGLTTFAVLLGVVVAGVPSQAITKSPPQAITNSAAAPQVLQLGSRGRNVQQVQLALRAMTTYTSKIDGVFGAGTRTAQRSWEQANGLLRDGKLSVGSSEWRQLFAQAKVANSLTAKTCIASGRMACVSLSGKWAKLYVNRKLIMTSGAVGGVPTYPTLPGKWKVHTKVYQDYSSQFGGASMPRSVYFHRGKAFHYGSWAPSHGCVHLVTMKAANTFYNTLRLGDQVWVMK